MPKVLIIPIDCLKEAIEITKKIRSNGISCDIAYEKNLSKALDYANKEKIKYCLIVGKNELSLNKVRLRNMYEGKEIVDNLEKIINILELN